MFATNFSQGGFLDTLTDAESIREMLGAAGGGGAHALATGLVSANVGFFSDDGSAVGLLKRLGLSAGVGVLGAAALWGMNPDLAKGALGSFGADAVRMVAQRAGVDLHDAASPRLAGARRRLRGGARRRLQGTRVYDNETFSPIQGAQRGVGAVRVRDQDPAMAALAASGF